MNRPRAADDFATIRARMEELRREREQGDGGRHNVRSTPTMRSRRSIYWPDVEPKAGLEPVLPIRPLCS